MTTEAITIEVPDIDELLADHPHAVCTPLLGTSRVLPPKACPVAQRMMWTWKTIDRKIDVDGARIRIGDKVGSYPLTGGRQTFTPKDGLTLEAHLAGLGL